MILPRLLVINNLPAHYRTPAFAELSQVWHARTGGTTAVMYQSHRDPGRRAEWFYTPDSDLPFPFTVLSPSTKTVRGQTIYPLRPGIRAQSKLRPTHQLVAGWDTPVSIAAAIRGRVHRLRSVIWVESTQDTTRVKSSPAAALRRFVVGSASGVLAPTTASANYALAIAGRHLPCLVLPNPVDLERISFQEDRAASEYSRRVVFVGELSRRKGFDRLMQAIPILTEAGWEAAAWGAPTETPVIPASSGVKFHGPRPFPEILAELRPTDVWVIPSRRDPAPLTFSEALAAGIRLVVSQELAYASDWAGVPGVTVADCDDARDLAAAIIRAEQGPRPAPSCSERVAVTTWAAEVVSLLLNT